MGIAILVTAITIYAIGIFKSESPLFTVLSADFRTTGSANCLLYTSPSPRDCS